MYVDQNMHFIHSTDACTRDHGEISSQLRTNTAVGLSVRDVTQRRALLGYNEFDIAQDDPLWVKYLSQVTTMLFDHFLK